MMGFFFSLMSHHKAVPTCFVFFFLLSCTCFTSTVLVKVKLVDVSYLQQIILGSSSKARRQILAEMGYEFTIMTADIDEKSIRKEKPEDLVMALAEAKVVVYQGIIREKPTSEKEAREFIFCP
ncbi:uncharacterized protein LOC130980857 [Arachis stenosperma]|uniref:uncharacterized protein LOC130980857 n=1 Tax=Arachis stenosperma TaxID=217475 RepID=UPI0025ACF6C3|nr:uncharacterized protein LOC130980857 [Arachis stenosperma]